MPCWTTTTTSVALDAEGLNEDRLRAAAAEHGIAATIVNENGKRRVVLRDYSARSVEEVERIVRQEYSKRTVADGLRKFGFRVQKTTNTGTGSTVKLTVGR
jgi:hypothetical protein